MLRIALLSLVLMPVVAAATPPAALRDRHRADAGPYVELWTNQDDVYQRGERVRLYFRTAQSGYVTIFRIDTDGRVRVLFPLEPWDDNYARGGERYEVRGYGDRYAFVVDDDPGEGYVFAVASLDPFAYGGLVRGDHWDYRVIAAGGRVTGDPYVALTDLVDRIVPENYTSYSYDVLPYYVQRHYEYPRFLCYDCHSFASYSYWDPYAYSCFRFRIVVYNDPYYYPARTYGATRVIYRTTRIAPRYVFKDRTPSQPFVTAARERPVDVAGRRTVDAGVTGRDLGGVGRIPVPSERRPLGGGGRGVPDVGAPERRRALEPEPGVTPEARRPVVGPETVRPGEIERRPNTGQGQEERQPEARPNIQPPVSEPLPRPRPQLERREPRREPEPQPEVRQPQRPREEPRRVEPEDRPQVRPEREPERRVEPARPEPRRAEPRQEPQPQPRAEPRPEPRREPVQKPQDPESRRPDPN